MMFEKEFSEIEKHRRSASIAEIGGFHSETEGIKSWFGGDFHMRPDEPWPTSNGKGMLSILQIRVDELPIIPDLIKDLKLITLFVSRDDIPLDFPSENGDGWMLRCYTSLDGLVKKTPKEQWIIPRPFQIRWNQFDNERPDWLEILEILDDPKIGLNNEFFEATWEGSRKYPYTKVGGWPATIQEEMHSINDPFVFQVASEEKPRWMLRDNGSMYFFRNGDKWTMYWDCY